MAQQPRILSRPETLLRHSSGATNLAAAPDQWYSLAPRYEDERFEISGISFMLAGPGLLTSLAGFAGSAGVLELGIDGYDGYGSVRDLASLVPQVLNSAADWNEGSYSRTMADAEAGMLRDGSTRVGLRGLPLRPPAGAPQPGWTSAAIDCRYGHKLAAISWDCWTLRDPSGATVAPPSVSVRTGTRAPGGLIAWNAYQTVASTAPEIDLGYANLAPPIDGDVFQLRLILPYADPGSAVTPSDSLLYTAVFFALCAWIELAASRWKFASMAEVLERSELVRTLAPASWTGGDDLALIRIPLNFALRGRFHETIRARVSAGTGLSVVEVAPLADLRFETTAR